MVIPSDPNIMNVVDDEAMVGQVQQNSSFQFMEFNQIQIRNERFTFNSILL